MRSWKEIGRVFVPDEPILGEKVVATGEAIVDKRQNLSASIAATVRQRSAVSKQTPCPTENEHERPDQ